MIALVRTGALLCATASLGLLAACGTSADPDVPPTPESASRSPAPDRDADAVAAETYADCTDAIAAFQAQVDEAVTSGSRGEIAAMERASRTSTKVIVVNDGCFPPEVVAAVPDPDAVEVTPLPEELARRVSQGCTQIVRDAQALLNFTSGASAGGETQYTRTLRRGFAALSSRDPECFPPAFAREFEDELDRTVAGTAP